MSKISEENKKLARIAAEAFGGKPKVSSYADENENETVDLLVCKDSPQKGVSSFSTIGLSDSSIEKNGKDIGIRVELVGACSNSVSDFPKILTTAAFCIINSRWACYPGAIFPDVVAMYNCSTTMKHLFFVPPFLWEDTLKTIEFKNKTVAWLLAVPISEEERQYVSQKGAEGLEDLFEMNQIDIFDINRPSVI